jgi:ribonuclease P protein component
VPLTFRVETSGLWLQPESTKADAVLLTRLDSRMPTKKTAGFPRAARLLRHADFERVYKQGRRHFSTCMTVFYWPRPEAAGEGRVQTKARAGAPSAVAQGRSAPQGLRVGFTVGRVLGGAVQRNRMKRRLREAVRMTLPAPGVAADVVINPKKGLLAADFADVVNEVKRAFGVIEQKLSGKATTRPGVAAPNEN